MEITNGSSGGAEAVNPADADSIRAPAARSIRIVPQGPQSHNASAAHPHVNRGGALGSPDFSARKSGGWWLPLSPLKLGIHSRSCKCGVRSARYGAGAGRFAHGPTRSTAGWNSPDRSWHLHGNALAITTAQRGGLLSPNVGGIPATDVEWRLARLRVFARAAHLLVWIALVPLAAAIAARGHLLAVLLGSFTGGLAFNLIATDWMRTLEGGAGLTGRLAPDWLFHAQLLALFWPVTLLCGRVLDRVGRLPMGLTLPVAWTLHEWMLRNLWALVDQTGWHMYLLGYAVIDYRNLSQIADLGGAAALGALVACVNGAIWDVISPYVSGKEQRALSRGFTSLAIAAGLLAFSYGYGAWAIASTETADGPTVWLMPDAALQDPLTNRPWSDGSAARPDVLLWSELAYHGPASDSAPSRLNLEARGRATAQTTEQSLSALARQFDVPLVVGYIRATRGEEAKYNSAAFVDPQLGWQGSYDKIGLVPWREFEPIAGFRPRKGWKFRHGANYPLFQLSGADGETRSRFGLAICYDVAFASLFCRAMRAADGPPDFFLVCSSEQSDNSGRLARHLLDLARMRAIECRRSLVRNVHGGYSGRIDSTGALVDDSLPVFIRRPTGLGPVSLDARSTLASLWGDWLSGTILGLAVLVIVSQCCRDRWRGRAARHTAG